MQDTRFDKSNRLYRPDIDGIRAIAILSVILYHARVPNIHGGFTGVDIFFVISGYLIGGHIFSDLQAGSFSFLQFYRLRAKRILPAFYVMLAFTILAALLLLSPFEAREFGKSAFAATLSASNIYFWKNASYFDTQSGLKPLLMTWSLGIEEQFYAVIPLLMVILVRIRRNLLLPVLMTVCSLSFFLSCRELSLHPVSAFYLLPERLWELGVGVTLAVYELRAARTFSYLRIASWIAPIGVVLMMAPMVMLNADTPFPGIAALPSVLGTALIIATPASSINRRLLSFSPLVFIGKISYSWYLCHWPILAFLRVISGGDLPPVVIALAIAASFGTAIVSYFLVEQPLRRSTLAPVPLLLRYGLVSIVFLALCGVMWRSNGFSQRYPQLAQIESGITSLESDPCSSRNDKPILSARCYTMSGDRPAVALWGDSHAAALAPGLRSIAKTAGYDFFQLTKSACRPMSEEVFDRRSIPPPIAECMSFNRIVLHQLEIDSRIRIVIISDAWGHIFLKSRDITKEVNDIEGQHYTLGVNLSQDVTMHFLEASIRSLQAKGKQVIVFEDTPYFGADPLSIVRVDMMPIRHTLAMWLGVVNNRDASSLSFRTTAYDVSSSALLHAAISAVPGVELVDLKHALCNETGRCVYRKGDQVFFNDYQHLSPDGAHYALRDFHLPSADSGLGYEVVP